MITQWIFYFGTVPPEDEPVSLPGKALRLELPIEQSKSLYTINRGSYVIPGNHAFSCRELFESAVTQHAYQAIGFRPFSGKSAEYTSGIIVQAEEVLELSKRSTLSKKNVTLDNGNTFSILWINLAPFWHPTSLETRCRLSFLTMLLRGTRTHLSLQGVVKNSASRNAMERFLSGHTLFTGKHWNSKQLWQHHFNFQTKNAIRNKLAKP